MDYKSILLLCILLSVAFCFTRNRRDTDEMDSEEVDVMEESHSLRELMHKNRLEAMDHLDLKLAGLMHFMEETLDRKLDHIATVVESVERRQKFAELCTPGICGDHGTCELSEDGDTFECDCEEGYAGVHCALTGPCDIERFNVLRMPPMPGMELPHCDEDGFYGGMQYGGSQAHCVTREGEAIDGYSVNRWETGDDMNCQCARDEYLNLHEESLFACDPNGNYPQVACNEEECWCQDWLGQQYGESVPIGELDTALKC